jgi:AcrR family transcriptional regulator
MGRPIKEKSLNPQDVVKAAINCLDKEGELALGVNRVARELGIKPPAIYKHLDGNTGLRRAVSLEICRIFFDHCEEKMVGIQNHRELLKAGGQATRDFAKIYPARFRVMNQFQLQPQDADAMEIIQISLRIYQRIFAPYNLDENQLIDAMRIMNSAMSGFINLELAGMLTLGRHADESYEVMLDVLLMAIENLKSLIPNSPPVNGDIKSG